MGKGGKLTLVLLVAAALLAAGYALWRSRGAEPAETSLAPGAGPGIEVPLVSVDLYFADAAGERLAIERREVAGGGTPEELVRVIAAELAAGPRDKALIATLPPSAAVRSVFLRGDTAFVDFTAPLAGDHPGGSWTETLTVYSVVNSVAANVPGVARVQLLLEGKQGQTVAGHLVLDRPLAPRASLLDGKF